jgi:rubrerythrin
LLGWVDESRRREKSQALFYRNLAAEAEEAGRADDAERLNELHADEQHHLSRLTARLLELGATPSDLRDVPAPVVSLVDWEARAREREYDEISWYEGGLAREVDATTRDALLEILVSERHHCEELRGKWMSA